MQKFMVAGILGAVLAVSGVASAQCGGGSCAPGNRNQPNTLPLNTGGPVGPSGQPIYYPNGQTYPATGNQTQRQRYTCPMHPEVVSNKPGKCPKCQMDLVPKKS